MKKETLKWFLDLDVDQFYLKVMRNFLCFSTRNYKYNHKMEYM